MEESWSKLCSDYEAIAAETSAWLCGCSQDTAQAIAEDLHNLGVPWDAVCVRYGGSISRFPEEPIQAAIDSYLLKTAIVAITADGTVSSQELAECWPLTKHIAKSLGQQFSDLRHFDHSSIEGHCDFLHAFNEKESWFGGACEWTVAAVPALVLYASIVQDAEKNCDTRSLFKKLRALCRRVVRGIISADGVTDEEALLLKQVSDHFDILLYSSLRTETNSSATQDSPQTRLLNSEVKKASTSAEQKTIGRDEALATATGELDKLIGLHNVKLEVQRLTSFLKIQQARKGQNLKTATQSLHFVFKGNPGTGKTVVARILSKVFYGFGILDSFHVVECDRSKLVGGYVGQTAIKTDELIDSALDGVLFIDEAYTLSKDAGGNDFGGEAINQLLKRMEDDRKRLIVIVAGYPKLMDDFIGTNPGLKSRFTRYISFEDYSASELCQIFEKFATDDQYVLSDDCRIKLAVLFAAMYLRRGTDFGNARDARNIYEKAITIQSERLVQQGGIGGEQTKEQLTTLAAEDIDLFLKEVLGEDLIDMSKAQWRFSCPTCDHAGVETGRFLGRRVKCKCGSAFIFPWWDLIPETIPALLKQSSNFTNPFLPS